MTTNYTQAGTDIENVLVPRTNKNAVPVAMRKEGHEMWLPELSVWAWGYNLYGQLGDGTTTHKSSPIQVGSLTNWAAIAGGNYHTIALKY